MNCPNCGHLIDTNDLSAAHRGTMQAIGGAEEFGRVIGERFNDTEAHAKLGWARVVRDTMVEESKLRQRQERLDEVEDDDAILADFAVAKIEAGDMEFAHRIYRALVRRKLTEETVNA